MRGVDVGTKREVYGLIREEAARGRTFLWYTTETDELFEHCDRVYVFREGAIVADLPREAADRGQGAARLVPGRRVSRDRGSSPRRAAAALLPALSLAAHPRRRSSSCSRGRRATSG